MAGRVYLIGAGPGDPGLLTLKAKACIEQCDVVVYDRLVSPEVLAFVPTHAQRIYVGKENKRHTMPQIDIERCLIEHAQRGAVVGRLKGGDPFVFGRGAEEAEALRANGIDFEIIPGISSAIAVPAYAGIPLTHRELATGFHVVTGHECLHSLGMPWELLAMSSQTLVVLMGLGSIGEIADTLMAHGRSDATPVAVIASGTTREQKVVVAPLCEIAAATARTGIPSPAVIVVGDVVRLRSQLQWFENGLHFAEEEGEFAWQAKSS